MGLKKLANRPDGYFETLPKGTIAIVKECILNAADARQGPEGYKLDDECIENIECHSRDGFIPDSHNRGGITYRNFTNLMDYYGGGYTPKHDKAAKEIQKQIEYSFKCVKEDMIEFIGAQDMEYYFGNNKDKLSYSSLDDLELSLEAQGNVPDSVTKVSKWLSEFAERETNYLGDSDNSIMHELRFMYHGKENGTHCASVSAAINTEAPYHRSSISWAPGVFCEGAKEVEISWNTQKELKEKLSKAFAKVSKEIF